jgi:hypothetical protein
MNRSKRPPWLSTIIAVLAALVIPITGCGSDESPTTATEAKKKQNSAKKAGTVAELLLRGVLPAHCIDHRRWSMQATICVRMKRRETSFQARARAAEKQRSRRLDERAIFGGDKSVAQLKRENEVFAPLATAARVDLAASRSLG